MTRLLGPTVERIPGLSPCFGHRLQRGTNVAEESHLWPSQTADVLGPDVDLDDLLTWRKERWAAIDQIRVEPRTQDQGDVGRSQSDPSMDQPSQASRVVVVDQPASRAGGGHRNAGSLGESTERFARPGEERARPSQRDRPARFLKKGDGPVHIRRHGDGSQIRGVTGRPGLLRRERRCAEHILRDFQVGDARGAGTGLVNRLGNVLRDPFGLEAFGSPLRDGCHGGQLVEVLHGAAVSLGQTGPPADDDQRDPGGVRLGEPSESVGDAGTCRDCRGSWSAHGQCPSFRHEHGVLLVPGVDQPETLDPRTLEQGKDVSTREGEDRFDTRILECPCRQHTAVGRIPHRGGSIGCPRWPGLLLG